MIAAWATVQRMNYKVANKGSWEDSWEATAAYKVRDDGGLDQAVVVEVKKVDILTSVLEEKLTGTTDGLDVKVLSMEYTRMPPRFQVLLTAWVWHLYCGEIGEE